jgi:hypothetical protein
MHEDTRMTVLAWATAADSGVTGIGFLPCRLTADGLVHPLRAGSPESDEVVRYIETCNSSQRLAVRLLESTVTLDGFATYRIEPVSE